MRATPTEVLRSASTNELCIFYHCFCDGKLEIHQANIISYNSIILINLVLYSTKLPGFSTSSSSFNTNPLPIPPPESVLQFKSVFPRLATLHFVLQSNFTSSLLLLSCSITPFNWCFFSSVKSQQASFLNTKT